jgi:hypothetical protein
MRRKVAAYDHIYENFFGNIQVNQILRTERQSVNFSSNELLLHMSQITLLYELWLVVFTSVTRHTL